VQSSRQCLLARLIYFTQAIHLGKTEALLARALFSGSGQRRINPGSQFPLRADTERWALFALGRRSATRTPSTKYLLIRRLL